MGTLVLVRHGQASLFADDYDKLSALGVEQSRLLGEHWAGLGARFDAVFCGTLKRQIGTARAVAEAYAARGLDFPEPVSLPAFDEYDADGVVRALAPELAARDPQFAELARANVEAVEPKDRYRAFHRMLEAAMFAWQNDERESAEFETWKAFSTRVREGIREAVRGEGGGRRVAIFTSGGPVGTAVQTVLRAPEPAALELNWRVRNASTTEIEFGRGRFTLSHFNAIGHLADPATWTYR